MMLVSRRFFCSAAFSAAFSLAACSREAPGAAQSAADASPEVRAVELKTFIYEGKTAEVISLADFSPFSRAAAKGKQRGLAGMTTDRKRIAQAEGGLAKVELLEPFDPEKIKAGRLSAELKVSFKNGRALRESIRLIRVDGVWKLDLSEF